MILGLVFLYTVEPPYKGLHAGTIKIERYPEVELYTKVLASDRNKCPLYIERCPLFGVSFIRGSTAPPFRLMSAPSVMSSL